MFFNQSDIYLHFTYSKRRRRSKPDNGTSVQAFVVSFRRLVRQSRRFYAAAVTPYTRRTGEKEPNHVSPTDHVELLGFRTHESERAELHYVVSDPILGYRPASVPWTLQLHKVFGTSIRDHFEGNSFDPSDPASLSQKLDEYLEKYGPLLWPEPGRGDRGHLREPQEGTNYTRHLIYPRDSNILKDHLRAVVLCEEANSKTNSESHIKKIHSDLKTAEIGSEDRVTADMPLATKRRSIESIDNSTVSRRTESEECEMDTSSGEHEYMVSSVRGTSQASTWSRDPLDPHFNIELRLHRSRKRSASIDPGLTWSRANLMFTERTQSCEDLFVLICNKIEADCSFIIVHLPEDMSTEGQVRIDRGSKESEVVFHCVRGILQRARKFPCGPLHRSVEVEIGLGLD